jgi:hypothetical protein
MKKIIHLMVMLSLSLLVNCDNFQSKELSPEKKLELAEKCSKAGKEYFNDYWRSNNSEGYRWDDPEYHYNSRLNTCLIHIRYVLIESYDTKLSFHYNQVMDIFSNKAIIYGWFERDIGKKTETLIDTPSSSVPNFTSTEYIKEKDKLFSE